MSVFIASGESLEMREVPGIPNLDLKDVFEDIEGTRASAGKSIAGKGGWRVDNWNYNYDELQYIIKGTETLEFEGKTLVAHGGDFIQIQKGTIVTQTCEEGTELIFITIPSLKTLGII